MASKEVFIAVLEVATAVETVRGRECVDEEVTDERGLLEEENELTTGAPEANVVAKEDVVMVDVVTTVESLKEDFEDDEVHGIDIAVVEEVFPSLFNLPLSLHSPLVKFLKETGVTGAPVGREDPPTGGTFLFVEEEELSMNDG